MVAKKLEFRFLSYFIFLVKLNRSIYNESKEENLEILIIY